MLKQRIPTAIVLVAIVSAAIFALSYNYFQIFLGLVIAIAAWEWAGLSGLKTITQKSLYTLVITSCIVLVKILLNDYINLFLILSLLFWLLMLGFILSYPKYQNRWSNKISLLLMGAFVLLPGWFAIVYLRSQEHSSTLILLLLGMVAAADIGAYFSGKAFGKHKLAEQVSPNKTWEGYWGGVLACCLLGCVVAAYYSRSLVELPSWFWFRIIFSAWLLASFSVVGDLLESMVKRFRGVKDSGRILPGHGGILDRIDGVTSAAPVFALLLFNGII